MYTEGHGLMEPTEPHHLQRAEQAISEVPKPDTLLPLAAPLDAVHENHKHNR